MANSLVNKLRIRPGYTLQTFHSPKNFRELLGELPAGVKITNKSASPDQVHWFVMNEKQMNSELNRVLKSIKDDVVCWIYYPKGSSGIQTDLSRDKGWDKLMENDSLSFISLISFDETWSAFGVRRKKDADKVREANKKPREILNYIDPVAKKVSLPEDLEKELRKNKKESDYFHSLAFSHKKEYVEWLVTAKKEETRNNRLSGIMERLRKGWKNPRNL